MDFTSTDKHHLSWRSFLGIFALASLGACAADVPEEVSPDGEASYGSIFDPQKATPPSNVRFVATDKSRSTEERLAQLTKAAQSKSVDFTCSEESWLIQADNGNNATAQLNYTGSNYGMLRASSTNSDEWEEFKVCTDGTHFAFLSAANWLYVSAEMWYTGSAYAMLRARASSVSDWEKFQIGAGTIRAVDNNLLVAGEFSYSGGDYGMLRARSSSWGAWETFWIVSF